MPSCKSNDSSDTDTQKLQVIVIAVIAIVQVVVIKQYLVTRTSNSLHSNDRQPVIVTVAMQ